MIPAACAVRKADHVSNIKVAADGAIYKKVGRIQMCIITKLGNFSAKLFFKDQIA